VTGIEGTEVFRIKGWDSTNNIGEIEGQTENEYALGDSVYGLFGDYNLDLSDTDTYSKGIVLRLLWTPTGSGTPVTWEAQVSAAALDITGVRQDLEDLYPRAYDAFTVPHDRFDRMKVIAERQMTSEAYADNWDIQRVVDQEAVKDALVSKMALLWCLNGDVNIEDEEKRIGNEYATRFGVLKKMSLWTDDDQDGIEDEGEKIGHSEPVFERRWG
jgi:hypothetical protein